MDSSDEIYQAAGICSERFEACIASPASREHVISIRSAQGDFNLWCATIKAASRGKASLDYRLRNHQDVREVVCGLLAGLATSLGRLTRRATVIFGDGEIPVDIVEEVPESPSSTDSPVSWDAISEEWSNPDSAQAQDDPSMDPMMAEYMSYVKTTLDQLARISLAIRKAGNKFRFEKIDAELDEDAFEEFRNHLASIILRAFPDPEAQGLSAEQKMKRVSDYGALTSVQKRLVHANILRKHRIEFVTKSRRKGERPAPGVIELTKDPRRLGEARTRVTSSVAGSQNSSRVQGPASRRQPVPGVSGAAPTPSVIFTAAPTATDVGSRLDVKHLLSAQTASKVTKLTKVGSTQAYPNCPKLGPDGLLICPYCDDVLPSSYAKMEQSWKAHVIQDLMPYSCFIDECETPYELYLTTENLLAHVMDKHSSVRWICNFCSSGGQATGSSLTHTRRDFWSAEAWEDHVKQIHADRIKVVQLPVLAELSKRSVVGPLSCPLCDFSTDAVDSRIADHILQHLHEFSLRALPESSDPVTDERSKASQMSGSLSHVKDAEREEQGSLDYALVKQTQWSAVLQRVRAFYHSPSLDLLMNHVYGSPDVDSVDSATAEFWGFHFLKLSNVLEIINSFTMRVEGTDITNEMITDIVDQISISILDSLSWFSCGLPLSAAAAGRSFPFQEGDFSIDMPLPQPGIPFTNREEIQDEVEFHLFQQRSVLYLNSSTQPKNQPRVVLTGGSGVGKTAIALRLAHQIKEEKPGCTVFWVDASDIHSVSRAYFEIWMDIGKGKDVAFLETPLVYFLNWVFRGEWLMILDGIDGPTLHNMQVEGRLPSGLGGRLLLTTQDTSCLSLLGQVKEVRVPPLDEELPFPAIPAPPPSRPEDFDVAIICLSSREFDAMHSLFTEVWEGDPRDYGKANDKFSRTSENSLRYCAGYIYGCNAVLVLGPEEIVVHEIRSNFKGIQLTLLVDICSGLPLANDGSTKGIFRGDVIISSEAVQYRVPTHNALGGPENDIIPPNEHVRPLLNIMESSDGLKRVRRNTAYFLKELQATSSASPDFYAYPGVVEDKLFRLSYAHKHHGSLKCLCNDGHNKRQVCSEAFGSSCDALGCDNQYLVDRESAQGQPTPHNSDGVQPPSLHCGRIALIGGVNKLAARNVVLSSDSSILALMESGLPALESLPCIVIQGVRDYADLHNQQMWSNFAAATAASAAKAILGEYSRLSPWMVPFNKESHFVGREEILERILSRITPGTNEDVCQRTAIVGPEGIGKTQVALEAARLFRLQHPGCSVFWVSGRSASDIYDGFRGIGRRLRVSNVSDDDLQPGENMTSYVKMQLDRISAGDWLLIIDDVGSWTPTGLTLWAPSSPNGSVLLISRNTILPTLLGLDETATIRVPAMNGKEATEMFRRYVPEALWGNTESLVDIQYWFDKLQCSPLQIVQTCAAISASGTSATLHLQHVLAASKNAITQPGKSKEQEETDQGDRLDLQTMSPLSVPTGQTPTTVAPLSGEVEDEVKEGVWGYLIPIQGGFGKDPVIVLRKRAGEAGVEETNPRKQGRMAIQNPEREKAEAAQPRQSPSGGFLIGRHPDCGHIIDDPNVSNRHCLLFFENREQDVVAILEDISRNGTFVNEAIVGRNHRRELEDHDEIAIIDVARFVFRYPVTRRMGNTFLQHYTLSDRIGKGHFAEIFICIEKSTGHRYAVKVFTKHPGIEDKSKTEGLEQEIAVLLGVSHPNILNLKDTFNEKDAVYLVLDLAPEGELFDLIVRKQKLTEPEARKIFSQLFKGVKYLHDRDIIHRDIKPENILLCDQDWNLKIADFGLAKVVGAEEFTTTLCGTPSYVAPEILSEGKHRKYTKAVDVWSLGVVLYICLCGFPPFSDELSSEDFPYTLSQQIKGSRFDYPSPYWDSVGDPALDLIDHMLVVAPEKRYTVDQCIAHPWMTESFSGDLPTPSRRGSRAEGHEAPRRGMARERTLLSTINDVNVNEVFRGFDQTSAPTRIYSKNSSGIVAEPEELQGSE